MSNVGGFINKRRITVKVSQGSRLTFIVFAIIYNWVNIASRQWKQFDQFSFHLDIYTYPHTIHNFRRDAEDTEWIRILTLLGLSADLYNDMTSDNINKNCPSKLICQAFESRDILGLSPLAEDRTDWSISRIRGLLHQENLPALHVSPLSNWQPGPGGLESQPTDREITLTPAIHLYSLLSGRKLLLLQQVLRVSTVSHFIVTKTPGRERQLLEE